MLTIDTNHVRSAAQVGGLSGARAIAREGGECTILLADGRLRLYYRDNGKLRQRTWAKSAWRFNR